MRITIDVSPTGKIGLHCDVDQPWQLLAALRAAADAVINERAAREAATAVVLAKGPLPRLVNGTAQGG